MAVLIVNYSLFTLFLVHLSMMKC